MVEQPRGPVLQQIRDGSEFLDVRERSSSVKMQVRVRDLSPYRHVVCLDGKEYQLINVWRDT
jgi:hypothetical protein